MTHRSSCSSATNFSGLGKRIPVHVEYFVNNPGRLSSDTVTTKVNAHGALLQSPWGVPVGWKLLLQNLASLETQIVIVASVEYAGDDYYDLGVEFAEPNPAFWGKALSPDDWSPPPS
jgi:hypothetical protein